MKFPDIVSFCNTFIVLPCVLRHLVVVLFSSLLALFGFPVRCFLSLSVDLLRLLHCLLFFFFLYFCSPVLYTRFSLLIVVNHQQKLVIREKKHTLIFFNLWLDYYYVQEKFFVHLYDNTSLIAPTTKHRRL